MLRTTLVGVLVSAAFLAGGCSDTSDAPAIEMTAPTADLVIHPGDPIVASFRCTALPRESSVQMFFDEDGDLEEGLVPYVGSMDYRIPEVGGPFSLDLRTWGLKPGVYHVIGRAQSLGGMSAAVPASGRIEVNAKPAAWFVVPSSSLTVRPGDTVQILYGDDDADNEALTSMFADLDGNPNTTNDQVTIASGRVDGNGATQTLTWDTSGVAPGTYTLFLESTDGIGTPTLVQSRFWVDINVAPSIEIHEPLVDLDLEAGEQVEIVFEDMDPDDVARTTFYADSDGDPSTISDRIVIFSRIDEGDGEIRSMMWDTGNFRPGSYTIVGICSDGHGDPVVIATASGTVTISNAEFTEVVLSEMVLIPGNTQGWVWERQNDYADDLGFGYLSAGGYMEIDPNDPDPWAFSQEVPAVEDTVLRQTEDVSHYLEVGVLPAKAIVYGQVWDYDNDYYVFHLKAGTRVTWWYTGALPVTSELIAHPDLNPGGVVQLVSENSYRVETTGFYFYKQERRGYSPADGNYDVPPGFPHFQCFRLDLTFEQTVTKDQIVAALGEPDTTQETGGTIYDVWYIAGTANTAPTIEVLWRHNDLRVFYQNGAGYVATEYSGPRWMRSTWFVDFAPLLVPGPGELTAADEAWLADHPLALGDNG